MLEVCVLFGRHRLDAARASSKCIAQPLTCSVVLSHATDQLAEVGCDFRHDLPPVLQLGASYRLKILSNFHFGGQISAVYLCPAPLQQISCVSFALFWELLAGKSQWSGTPTTSRRPTEAPAEVIEAFKRFYGPP
jgi:hypothetical protein